MKLISLMVLSDSMFVAENGDVDTNLIEIETGEPYVLYKTNASGMFVGKVRAAVEAVLMEIADACYDSSVFKTNQAQMAVEYVRKKYGDELEFLWAKFPDSWYTLVLDDRISDEEMQLRITESYELAKK